MTTTRSACCSIQRTRGTPCHTHPVTVLGLDVGGTKLAAALASDDGRLLRTARLPTPRTDVLAACLSVLHEVARGADVHAVGIGSAGPVDVGTGTVDPVNIPQLRGVPLLAGVAAAFGGAEVQLAGDGACMALAEQRFGAGRGTPNLLGVVVSTGVGGGLVLDGQVVTGRTGNAGHVGHMVADPAGEACPCGARGCLETIASGPSAVRWAQAQGFSGADGADLAASARAGDPVAVAAVARAGTALGQVLASAAALVDVELVVLGGGFAAAGEPLWTAARTAISQHAAMSFVRGLRLVPAELGPDAGLVGAAALVL
jgi:glucokinase